MHTRNAIIKLLKHYPACATIRKIFSYCDGRESSTFITRRVESAWRFYGLNLKQEMVVLECRIPSIMEKMDADSKAKGLREETRIYTQRYGLCTKKGYNSYE